LKAAACFLFLLGAATIHAPEAPASTAGRYQLVPATVATSYIRGTNWSVETGPELFRIDTATGRTWRLATVNVNGTGTREWAPIPQPEK
jgi:hypothetical protein